MIPLYALLFTVDPTISILSDDSISIPAAVVLSELVVLLIYPLVLFCTKIPWNVLFAICVPFIVKFETL